MSDRLDTPAGRADTTVCEACGQRIEVVAGTDALSTHAAPLGMECSRSGEQMTPRERRSAR